MKICLSLDGNQVIVTTSKILFPQVRGIMNKNFFPVLFVFLLLSCC